jgi:hypothetical protein
MYIVYMGAAIFVDIPYRKETSSKLSLVTNGSYVDIERATLN